MNKKLLFLIVLIGFIIRFILLNSNCIIEIDGSIYMKLAENLISGNGYKDLTGNTNVLFLPLYPLISGIIGFLISNFELAGRLVSLIFGTGLIFIMYLLGKKMYSENVGLICSALAALYPVLTYISGIAYSESLYLFLFTLSLYLGWLALESKNSLKFFISGLIFGLAYLTKSEAIFFIFIFMILTLIYNNYWKYKIKNVSLLLLGFVIISLPYWIFLYTQLGHFTLGTKGSAEFLEKAYIVSQSEDVKEYELAYLSLDYSAKNYKENMGGALNYFLGNPIKIIKRYFSNIYLEQTTAITKLYPLIFTLIAFFGLIKSNYLDNKQKIVYLLSFFLAPLLVLPISYVSPRVILSNLIILLVWTSKGIKELDKIIRNKFRIKYLILSLILLVFLAGNYLISNINISDTKFTTDIQKNCIYKTAGLWLKENYENTTLMTRDLRISYYAGALHKVLPYGDIQHIIKEACKTNVNFVVLDRPKIEKLRPELLYLLDEKKIPDNLKFIHKFNQDVLIYQPVC